MCGMRPTTPAPGPIVPDTRKAHLTIIGSSSRHATRSSRINRAFRVGFFAKAAPSSACGNCRRRLPIVRLLVPPSICVKGFAWVLRVASPSHSRPRFHTSGSFPIPSTKVRQWSSSARGTARLSSIASA